MKSAAIAGIVLIMLSSLPASADMYRYTDSKGELHFVDDLSKVPKKYRKQAQAAPLGDISITERSPATFTPTVHEDEKPSRDNRAQVRSDGQVEVYLTSWCGYCKKTLKLLNDKGIPYTAYDIEKDSSAQSAYKALGGRGVPVVKVGGKVIHGYNPGAILSALSLE